MTQEEFDKLYGGGGTVGQSQPSAPGYQAPASGGGSTLGTIATEGGRFARGAARGVVGDVAGLAEAGTNLVGLGPMGLDKVREWSDSSKDADWAETAGRWTGEYGTLAIPGLDLGVGARLGVKGAGKAAEWLADKPELVEKIAQKLGPQRAAEVWNAIADYLPKAGSAVTKGAIGGASQDPDHPVEGATLGAGTALAAPAIRGGASAAWSQVPSWARHLAGYGAGGAAIGLGEEAMRSAMGGHGYFPGMWYMAHGVPSALGGLAGAVMGAPPGVQGALGAQEFGSGGDGETQGD